LPPPNSNSAIEAKLQQLQKAAVAIATGPGSIISESSGVQISQELLCGLSQS
jgi:hypothetical protein